MSTDNKLLMFQTILSTDYCHGNQFKELSLYKTFVNYTLSLNNSDDNDEKEKREKLSKHLYQAFDWNINKLVFR